MRLSDLQGQLDEFLLRPLSPPERTQAVVYLDDVLRQATAAREADGTPGWPAPHWLAFVDLQPQANWMHACCYLIVDQASQHITRVAAERPPQFGAFGPGWRVVWHSADVQAWQIMPVSDDASPRSTP
jgi:hypothetical protein